MGKKKLLSQQLLINEAKTFCLLESKFLNKELFGISDGKAIGTYIEHKFQRMLLEKYDTVIGSSASGIDLPAENINTDIKVTSIKQPQSSCPFRDAKQKIFGLGYNILVFVYEKEDNPRTQVSILKFVSCSFISKERTADYSITTHLRLMIKEKCNIDDIISFLMERNLPADEITMRSIAKQILKNPPRQGYLTVSNALQWRLQYARVVGLKKSVLGVNKII